MPNAHRRLSPVSELRKHIDSLCDDEIGYMASKASDPIPVEQPTPTLVKNWMRRTGWEVTLEGANRDVLVALRATRQVSCGSLILDVLDTAVIESPESDEHKLVAITAAFDRLLDRCHDTTLHTDVIVRRWVRSTRPDRPSKSPFELVIQATSERQYRRLLKRCICFWLRLWRLPIDTRERLTKGKLSLVRSQIIEQLWTHPCWTTQKGQRTSTHEMAALASDHEVGVGLVKRMKKNTMIMTAFRNTVMIRRLG